MAAKKKELEVLHQRTRRISIKINMLNTNDQVIESFEGITTDGSISVDADSSQRRSGSISMVLDAEQSLIPDPSSSVWLDKRCAIYIGLDDYLGATIWFKMGRFAIDNADINIQGAERTIKLELSDYMSFLDGTLGGELAHQINIPRSTYTISAAIREVLSDLGKVSVDDITLNGSSRVVPYNIEQASGSTVYELVQELVDLYKGYDFYFDKEGYLFIEKIKDHRDSVVVRSFNGDDDDFTIQSSTSTDFKNIRNTVWVWGDQLDDGSQPMATYSNKYARNTAAELNRIKDMKSGDICYIRSTDMSYVWFNTLYIGVAISSQPRPPISPRSYSWSRITDKGGIYEGGEFIHVKYSDNGGRSFTGNNGEDGGGWVGIYTDNKKSDSDDPTRYRWTKVEIRTGMMRVPIEHRYVWLVYSHYDDGGRVDGSDLFENPDAASWEPLNFNVVERFNVENIGEKTTVISKSNIFNDGQAQLEAEFILEERSNFAETITLTCVPLYDLDVNQKIRVNAKNGIEGEFLIASISIPLDISSPMSITARKLYH